MNIIKKGFFQKLPTSAPELASAPQRTQTRCPKLLAAPKLGPHTREKYISRNHELNCDNLNLINIYFLLFTIYLKIFSILF